MLNLIRRLSVIAILLIAAPIFAQIENADELQLQVDRDTTLAFGRFRRAIANQQWPDARNQLERLWTADPHVMVEDRSQTGVYIPLYLAVHRAADEMLAGPASEVMPASDPKRWKVKLGASEIGDFPGLALQAAGTHSAALPFVLLARTQQSRGHFALGQKTLRQIAPNAARMVGLSLSEGMPEDSAPTEDGIAVEEAANSEIPEFTSWDHRIPTSQRLRSRFQEILASVISQSGSAMNSTWRATVEPGALYLRTLSGFARHDAKTGEKQWEYPIDDGLLAAMRVGSVAGPVPGNFMPPGQSPTLSSRAADLVLRDRLVARSVVDSRHAYLVVADDQVRQRSSIPIFARQAEATFNRLVALEKDTGRRVWSFGHSTLKASLGPTDTGGWVLGLPLAIGRQLFVVVEWNGEIRLCCLEANSGQMNWSTVLSYPEQTIDRDPYRRHLALTPVEKDGVIYSLTGSGWLCSVDLLSRGLQFATRIRKQQVGGTTGAIVRQRGRVIRLTNRLPLGQSWNEAELRFVGNRLVAMADQRHALAIVDRESGVLIFHQNVSAGDFLIASNEAGLVLGNATKIRFLTADNGQTVWDAEIVSDDRPIGAGLIQRGRLIYPSINGAVVVRQMGNGEVLNRSESLLPANTWGRLQCLEGSDLLFDAPTRHIRLSTELNTKQTADPIDVANRLIRDRDWTTAIKVLTNALEQDPSPGLRRELEDSLFSSRLQMSLASEEVDRSFEQQDLTESQQLIVDILKLKFAADQNQTEVVRTQISKLLDRSQRELSQPIPEIGSQANSATTGGVHSQLSLLLFCTNALTQHLDASDDPAKELQAIGRLPDEVLVHLFHPAVMSDLEQRIADSSFNEQSMQLVLHDIALHAMHGGDFDVAAQWFADRLRNDRPQGGIRRAKWVLVRSVLAEQPEAFQEAVAAKHQLSSQEEFHREFQKQRVENYQQWQADEYDAIPVRAFPPSQLRSSQLFPTVLNDPFLQQYSLRTTAVDVGRIAVQNLVQAEDRFTFTARLESGSVYTSVPNVVGRIGSVLLVRGFRNLSAVSLLDQREIWGRRSVKSVSFSRRLSNFTIFESRRTPHPMMASTATWRIVGTGARWFGLIHGNQFQMVDSLTGQSLWNIDFTKPPAVIVATEDAVLVQQSHNDEIVYCFDRRTGMPQELNFDSELLPKVIRNVGREFVTWENAGPESSAALQWFLPGESMASKTVELTGLTHFQFLDEETLVGFGPEEKFGVVDLMTGKFSQHQIQSANGFNPAEPDLARRGLATDGVHFYVFDNKAVTPALQPWGRRTSMADGVLWAVDQGSGQTKWAIDLGENTILTTDQPELGLLILVTGITPQPMPPDRARVRALKRETGDVVFNHTVPVEPIMRTLRVSSSKPQSLDVTIHKMQISFNGKE